MGSTKFAVLALALALSGATSGQEKKITLGAAVQLTGRLANTGRYYGDGYQITVDKINQKGGVTVGGTKYQLALRIYDSQSDTNLGVRQYVQLLTQDKVNFLLGNYEYAAQLWENRAISQLRFDRGRPRVN